METILNYCNQMILLMGLLFAIAGGIMYVFPPKKINSLYGYRTASSMKNQQKWDFSQTYSAKLLFILGIVLIVVSFFKVVIKTSEETDVILGVALPLIGVITMIVVVEKALKKI
ncbi:SdpI family protein [Flavobacterium sp. xlx-214]|uniref:SdpI family protein n=1 Tax=unclassified Flavobacterium TaxID=196869 RepID=UPI0013D4B1FE|nr:MULTISPECIES: SdpI family protein [unclassified Flavobacterium]MBA5791292.1 SdpI family protein [Flavobacterium sp. xlx-221]QMI83549.1 SdpI family protein [Flavobacterium sp. xlx-214]